jgi:hypothetical protein
MREWTDRYNRPGVPPPLMYPELACFGLPILGPSWYIAVNSSEGADADVHSQFPVESCHTGVPAFDSSSTWRFRC